MDKDKPLNTEDFLKQQYSLTITICGAPNVGKSTLLNRLIGCKLAISSPKPQTTRFNIKGILTKDNKQLVFIDTPGIFKPKVSQLEKQIVKEAWQGFWGIDLACLVIDAEKGIDKSAKLVLEKTKNNNINMIAIINKADLVSMEQKILLSKELWSYNKFAEIFSVSAKTGKGCDKLLDYLLSITKQQDWQFGKDELTDKDSNFIVAEFVREQLFLYLEKELPYMLSCETELFQQNEDCIEISVLVKVGKENHKKIILGKNGNNLRKIIKKASINLEGILGRQVKLKIFIKYDKK